MIKETSFKTSTLHIQNFLLVFILTYKLQVQLKQLETAVTNIEQII